MMSETKLFINKGTKQVWEIQTKDHIKRLSKDPEFEEYVEKKKPATQKSEEKKEPEKEPEKESEEKKEEKK